MLAVSLIAIAGLLAGVFVSAVLLAWGGALAFYAWNHLGRGRAVLVWPRHDFVEDRASPSLSRVVFPAAAGLATPLTIIDESFPAPGAKSMHWLLVALPALVVAASLFSWITGADSLYALLGPGAPASDVVRSVIFVLQAVAILLIGLFVLRAMFRQQAASVAATAEEAEARAGELVAKIRRGEGPIPGAHVMQCSQVTWPGAIRKAIAEADVALFDVTELNDALLSDMRLAYQRLSPERIVLMCAASAQGTGDASVAEDGLPRQRAAALEEVAGPGIVRRSPMVARPRVDPGPGAAGAVTYHRLEQRLRTTLTEALAAR